jgi:hypothetical protein
MELVEFGRLTPAQRAEQPNRLIEMPLVAMWRALRPDATLPVGPVVLRRLPF